MAERRLMLALAKLIIAVAWADGQIDHEEITALKLLLLRLKSAGFARGVELSGREWAELTIYMDSPVDDAERERLLVDLQNTLRTRKDKALAISAIREVISADGRTTAEEQQVLAQFEQAINETTVGVAGFLGGLVGQRIRSEVADRAPNRERYFRDYLRNRVFYSLKQRERDSGKDIGLDDEQMYLLGLAGGLMAKVAHIDDQLDKEELREFARAIQSQWALTDSNAMFVAEVATSSLDKNFDTTYIMSELSNRASESMRRAIVHAMFAVANADGQISEDEMSMIRFLTYGINLTHHDYIDAKTTTIR